MGQRLALVAVSGLLAGVAACGGSQQEVVVSPPPPDNTPAPSATDAAVAEAPDLEPDDGAAQPRAKKPHARAARAGNSGDVNCCKGKNECKGRGGCKTDRNDCKGKNDCKGQGGCKMGDCLALDEPPPPPPSLKGNAATKAPPPPPAPAGPAGPKMCCRGLNECKGKGGCKTNDNDCKGKNACKGLGGCKTAC